MVHFKVKLDFSGRIPSVTHGYAGLSGSVAAVQRGWGQYDIQYNDDITTGVLSTAARVCVCFE